MDWSRLVEYVDIQSKCLVKLDRAAHKKFGDEVYMMTVKKIYDEKFTAEVQTKDGKVHRMTVSR